jgi:hypothetical protein
MGWGPPRRDIKGGNGEALVVTGVDLSHVLSIKWLCIYFFMIRREIWRRRTHLIPAAAEAQLNRAAYATQTHNGAQRLLLPLA